MNKNIPHDSLKPIPAETLAAIYSHHVVFGSAPADTMPTDFTLDPLFWKDQAALDFCAAFAGTEVSEDQEGVELDPLSAFAWAKEIIMAATGNPDAYKDYGLNLNDIALAFVKVGALEQSLAPYKNDGSEDRDYLANPANYSQELKMLAADHRKASYTKADGPQDTFDNIRSAIYQNRMKRQTVLTGTAWRQDWVSAPGGIIPKDYSSDSIGGHAIKCFGWMTLEDGQIYLLIQNSWSQNAGDKGVYYFPREVVNKEFVYGSLIFSEVAKDLVEYHNDNGLALADNPFYKLAIVFLNWLKELVGIETKTL